MTLTKKKMAIYGKKKIAYTVMVTELKTKDHER